MKPFLEYLEESSTVYHASETTLKQLKKAGFLELKEQENWKLVKGKKYFVAKEGSLVCAFVLPEKAPKSATLLAAHLDRPCLKLKINPELVNQGMIQLNCEIYGAPLLHSWLDRDLEIAGKITFVNEKGDIASKIISLKDHPVIIPNLALHLDREVQEKGVVIHKQDHLKAIFSLNGKPGDFTKALQKACKHKKLLSADLFLVPSQKPAILGDVVAAYGLDNLSSSFAVLQAICKAKPQIDLLSIAFFFDHEEVGSTSTKGANSAITNDLLTRITSNLGMSLDAFFQMKARSFCISADLVHGFHPNFLDKYDLDNAAFLGKGVAIKFNANQRYATSMETAGKLNFFALKHNIPIQGSTSKANIPTGSTLGPMMSAQANIQTIDLGIPGLAMHSARESIAAKDLEALCTLFEKAIGHDFS